MDSLSCLSGVKGWQGRVWQGAILFSSEPGWVLYWGLIGPEPIWSWIVSPLPYAIICFLVRENWEIKQLLQKVNFGSQNGASLRNCHWSTSEVGVNFHKNNQMLPAAEVCNALCLTRWDGRAGGAGAEQVSGSFSSRYQFWTGRRVREGMGTMP